MIRHPLKIYFSPFSVTVFSLLILFFVSCSSFAATQNLEAGRLIQEYVNAVQANQPDFIKEAWTNLNNDQQAVSYMRQNMPQLHYLFRVRGLYLEMQAIQAQRPKFFADNQRVSQTVEGAAETIKKALSPGEVEAVKFSLSKPDRSRLRTNGEIVATSQLTQRIDNQQIALSNPNQNRTDNQDYIQNRVQSMFDQKFQEAPEEFVQNGDVLDRESLLPDPDVRIKGLFTDITFKKSSAEEQYLNVYLNDRLIISDLKVSQRLELLRIYLERGTNILRISTKDQGLVKGLRNSFVVLTFKKALDGERRFSLNLSPGLVQTLRIESAL